MVLILGSLLSHASPRPLAGATFNPISRGDLSWIAQDRTSGTPVGEFDGIVRPALDPYAGAWLTPRWALVAGLGVARVTVMSRADNVTRQRHWGVVRPALDVWLVPGKREVRLASFGVLAGGYGDIPSARDTSDGYTLDERRIADEDAAAERARLGGGGFRVGGFADWRPAPGIAIGVQAAFRAHFSTARTAESSDVSVWLAAEPALRLTLER